LMVPVDVVPSPHAMVAENALARSAGPAVNVATDPLNAVPAVVATVPNCAPRGASATCAVSVALAALPPLSLTLTTTVSVPCWRYVCAPTTSSTPEPCGPGTTVPDVVVPSPQRIETA